MLSNHKGTHGRRSPHKYAEAPSPNTTKEFEKVRTVVDEGVEGFVDHGAPREVRDGLELVVDVQLRFRAWWCV